MVQKLILVTAAFGNQGKLLIPKLVAGGTRVRALRRKAGGDAELRALGAAEIVIGDAADKAVLARAMTGVDAVYHVGPSAHPQERAMGMAAIDAAMAAGVRHFVFSSVLHAIAAGLVHHAIKRDIEEYLIGAPIAFTILQPADYMQVLRYAHAFETQEFVLAWDLDKRQAVVDLEDVTNVAAKILLEGEPHFGATYELSAPGCFSGHDIAAIIAAVTGKATKAIETDPLARMRDHFKDNPGDDGAEHRLRVFQSLQSWYSRHDFVGNPNVLAMLLGRQPTTLEAFIRREHARAGHS